MTETTDRYRGRIASSLDGVEAALALRGRVFRGGGDDTDRFDEWYNHAVVEDLATGQPRATFRFLPLVSGPAFEQYYSAQFYDLGRLATHNRVSIEIGRLCMDPDVRDPALLSVALGIIAEVAQTSGARLLFGCSSFEGTDPVAFAETLSYLHDNHRAPGARAPQPQARDTFSLADFQVEHFDKGKSLDQIPPLLRLYLSLGAWVGNHGVIDRDLGTFHLFTALELDRIPPDRRRAFLSLRP